MTVLFFEGFDDYDSILTGEDNALADAGWAFSYYGGSAQITQSVFGGPTKGGSIQLLASGATANDGNYICIDKYITPTQEACVSAFFRPDNEPYTTNRVLGIGTSSMSNIPTYARGAIIRVSAAGLLYLKTFPDEQIVYLGLGTVGVYTYYLELEVLTDGTVNVYLDGGKLATATMSGSEPMSYVGIGGGYVQPYSSCFYDHWVVSDVRNTSGKNLVVPIIPSGVGFGGNDFAVAPEGNLAWESLDDLQDGFGTDGDASYIEGNVSGAEQSVAVSSTYSFTGAAEAFRFRCSSKSTNPSPFHITPYLENSNGEVTLAEHIPNLGSYAQVASPIQYSLPGGLSLTQANFEACELGVRLQKF